MENTFLKRNVSTVHVSKIISFFSITIFIGLIFFTLVFIGQARAYSSFSPLPEEESSSFTDMQITPAPVTPRPTVPPPQPRELPSPYMGNDVFVVLNNSREDSGVNALKEDSDLCEVADYRLEEILDSGDLEKGSSLKEISDSGTELSQKLNSFSNTIEIAASGAEDVEAIITLWQSNPETNELFVGGQYVWGCIRSKHMFTIALASF